MKVAVGLPQIGEDPARVLEAAREAEEAGAWGVWLFDNLAPLYRPERPILDGWSLAGPVARATRSVRVVSLVTRAGLRHPALVARMAAVVQAAAGGRFVLGLGVGDPASRREEARFGIDAPPTRAGRLAAAEEIARRVRGDDLPVRPRVPPPPVWVGGTAEPVLRLAARLADAWHGWGPPPGRFAELAAAVRQRAGRPVECWWGGEFDPATGEATMDALRAAGADGVTWMIVSRRDAAWRPALLELVRALGS